MSERTVALSRVIRIKGTLNTRVPIIYRTRITIHSHSTMAWQEGKASFGSAQYLNMDSLRTPCPVRNGSRANLNLHPADSSTGRSWSPSPRRNLSAEFEACLETTTLNSPEAQPRETMSGRMTPPLPEPVSNSEPSQSTEAPQETGNKPGNLPQREILWPSKRVYVFNIIELSEQSRQIMLNQLQWSELAMYSGVTLEQGSLAPLGKEPAWMLTLKIQGQNSGVGIAAKKLLLSMNFGVVSTSHTCSDGWIVIRSLWKSKDQVVFYGPRGSMSRAT